MLAVLESSTMGGIPRGVLARKGDSDMFGRRFAASKDGYKEKFEHETSSRFF